MLKRITKKMRAEVVELLRCAADKRGIGYAANSLDCFASDTQRLAILAWESTHARIRVPQTYEHVCLEAAQLLEEGWTP